MGKRKIHRMHGCTSNICTNGTTWIQRSFKVPAGFSSNIKGIINIADKKFQNLKSHDFHVIMTQLLPVALRGLLPDNVRLPIVKLCAFLNAISQKVIDPASLPKLQKDVAQCLVSFELVFPPILLRYYDASPASPSRGDCHSRSCISTQYVPLWEVHGSPKEICSDRKSVV